MRPADIAVAADKMISCGGWNIDEVRRKAGDAPLNTGESKKHFITKNYQEVGSMKAQEDADNPSKKNGTNEKEGEKDGSNET